MLEKENFFLKMLIYWVIYALVVNLDKSKMYEKFFSGKITSLTCKPPRNKDSSSIWLCHS
jgi:hypothetical protein